jgi:hypothetical protein
VLDKWCVGGDEWKETSDEKGLRSRATRSGWAVVEVRGSDSNGRGDVVKGAVVLLMSLIWEDNMALAVVLIKDAVDWRGIAKSFPVHIQHRVLKACSNDVWALEMPSRLQLRKCSESSVSYESMANSRSYELLSRSA